MPLIKSPSKKAVGQNIQTEMAAGKPRKQAIAIALNTQSRAGKPLMQRAKESRPKRASKKQAKVPTTMPY